MAKKIVGVYETRDEAVENIKNMQTSGYDPNNISVVAGDNAHTEYIERETGVTPEGWAVDVADSTDKKESGGILENITSALKGDPPSDEKKVKYSDRFIEMGIPEEEARAYDSQLADGKVVILAEEDVDETPETPVDEVPAAPVDETEEERAIRLREEQLEVSKEEVAKGEVEVHKDVVEEEKTVNVPVSKEEVYVKRRNVEDGEVAPDEAEIGEDEEIRIPVREEKVEVKKKPVTTDEVVVGKREVEETEQVKENLKREEAHIEEDGVEVEDEDYRDK